MFVYTAKTFNQIIVQVYNYDQFRKCAANWLSPFAQDAIHELILCLMEKKNKTQTMYREHWLEYYIFNLLKNFQSPTSHFKQQILRDHIHNEKSDGYKYHIENQVEYNDFKDQIYCEAKKILIRETINNPRKSFIYFRIFDLYFEQQMSIRDIHKLFKKINKDTNSKKYMGISVGGIHKYISEIKELIRNNLNQEYYDIINNKDE